MEPQGPYPLDTGSSELNCKATVPLSTNYSTKQWSTADQPRQTTLYTCDTVYVSPTGHYTATRPDNSTKGQTQQQQ